MRNKLFLIILCSIFLAGCAPSIVQRQNLLNTIKDRKNISNYTKGQVMDYYGFPSSQSISVVNGVKTEVWTYKTNLANKFLLINTHPVQTRYLKITFVENKTIDFIFE